MNPSAIAALEGEGGELADGTVGVYIHVEILPRACMESCGGLPATGIETPGLLLAVGVVLIVAGIAFLAVRTIRRRIRNRPGRPSRAIL
ncbi:LPXTG cell wall anchor domain-containing protein [Microbacterium aurantiacum]|uniref:LPXTG cell wall anchor domain-containing protein n=1 Tax=Microbacterium aurantiacum TaxID=162393 RepID=UPI000C80B709|nr:LPXTG cell wall anchor domain-containing protein [Microbacterium aurantiacum]